MLVLFNTVVLAKEFSLKRVLEFLNLFFYKKSVVTRGMDFKLSEVFTTEYLNLEPDLY